MHFRAPYGQRQRLEEHKRGLNQVKSRIAHLKPNNAFFQGVGVPADDESQAGGGAAASVLASPDDELARTVKRGDMLPPPPAVASAAGGPQAPPGTPRKTAANPVMTPKPQRASGPRRPANVADVVTTGAAVASSNSGAGAGQGDEPNSAKIRAEKQHNLREFVRAQRARLRSGGDATDLKVDIVVPPGLVAKPAGDASVGSRPTSSAGDSKQQAAKDVSALIAGPSAAAAGPEHSPFVMVKVGARKPIGVPTLRPVKTETQEQRVARLNSQIDTIRKQGQSVLGADLFGRVYKLLRERSDNPSTDDSDMDRSLNKMLSEEQYYMVRHIQQMVHCELLLAANRYRIAHRV